MVTDDTGDDWQSTRVLDNDEVPRGSGGTWPRGATKPVALEPGDEVGRYRIRERIGSGGMGVVYAADDPRLDRQVAVKLLRPSPGNDTTRAEARGRLLREAQAMAQLAHPNVLPVYDVGTLGERVFVAMEYVRGETLSQFLERHPPPGAIVQTLLAAGRGLAAAHAAGIVHRDFKPSNILVSGTGQVHVMDFGLARSISDRSQEFASHPELTTEQLSDDLGDDLTRTGIVMGTPAYMAPEQHRGEAPDPQSDQWSFCVTLHEALYGVRPFVGSDRTELLAAITAGKRSAPKGASSVPAWLRAVIDRGLAIAPEDRFPSMDALLAILERQGRGGRRWVAAGFVGAASLGAWAWASQGHASGIDCDDAAIVMDAVYGDTQRSEIAERFSATGLARAPESWSAAQPVLDAYAEQWVTARVAACEDSRNGDQDGAVLDLRMGCLQTRLDAVRGLVTMFAEPDDKIVDHAAVSVAGLPALDRCSDVQTLRSVAPSGDPEVRAAVRAMESELGQADVLIRSALYDDALTVAEAVLPRAEAAGHVATHVQALRVLGSVELELGRLDAGLDRLERAVWLAEENGMDREVAELASSLLFYTHAKQHRQQDADRWASLAKAKVDLVGGGGALAARLQTRLGDAADARGEYGKARELALDALQQWEALDPGGLEHANAIAGVGRTYFREQRWSDAMTTFERAAEMLAPIVGPNHPDVSRLRANIAVAAHASGDYETARDELLRVLPRFEELFGPEHPAVAKTLTNLGNAYYRLHDYSESLVHAERALAMKRKIHGAGQNLAYSLNNVAMVLLALDRYDEAATRYAEAIEILSITAGSEHPALAKAHEGLGEVLYKQGKLGEATENLRRAVQLEKLAETPVASQVVPTFLLARALWDGGETTEARTLATQANEWATAAQAGDFQMQRLAAETAAWLTAHPSR
ncbi:MAG: tetratricopeptide repeat protein [Myxococcota bacterium]